MQGFKVRGLCVCVEQVSFFVFSVCNKCFLPLHAERESTSTNCMLTVYSNPSLHNLVSFKFKAF